MKKILFIFLLIGPYAFAQNNSSTNKTVGFNSEFTYKMHDQNQDLRKINILLDAKKKSTIKDHSLIIGTSLISIFDYQHSNTDSKFAYLMRIPSANNQIGKDVSEVVIHSFQLSATAVVNSWLCTYAELLYNPEQSFGSGTITALGRNQIQLRKGFVLVGDLSRFPFYAALGKMDAPFGQTGSVNPFTNSMMWHAFGGLSYGAQIGFQKGGLHAKFMAAQGGSQFRAMNTIVGDSTEVPSKINNYVIDLNYSFTPIENVNLLIGASYLRGTIYGQGFPISHFAPLEENNPAYTYYTTINIYNTLIIKGSFAKTTKVSQGTFNPTPPLDVFEASKISSLELGAKYTLNQSDKLKYAISGEFSNFRSGPDGSPWERQNQIVLGFSMLFNNSFKFFFESFRTNGYTPFNFLTGSEDNAPFPAGTTPSIRDANSMGIVIGSQISF